MKTLRRFLLVAFLAALALPDSAQAQLLNPRTQRDFRNPVAMTLPPGPNITAGLQPRTTRIYTGVQLGYIGGVGQNNVPGVGPVGQTGPVGQAIGQYGQYGQTAGQQQYGQYGGQQYGQYGNGQYGMGGKPPQGGFNQIGGGGQFGSRYGL